MQGVIEATATTFDQLVLEERNLPVIVDFYATWCGPCRQLSPILERLSQDFAGQVKIVKVNADECIDLAASYNVSGLPTLLFFKDGVLIDRNPGLMSLSNLKTAIETLNQSA